MTVKTEKKEYIIDATGKRLGHIATEAASILQGKHMADFAKNTVAPVSVKIENARLLDIPENKKKEIYQSYSGYPGGRREERLEHLANRLGFSEVVRRTIAGMLPKNKLQKHMMHNLVVTD